MKQKIMRLTERDINKVIKECINRILKEETSVNYRQSWDDNGHHYSQVIRIGLTQEDLDNLNSKLAGMANEFDSDRHRLLHGHEMVPDYVRNTLKFGRNYLKLSQLHALYELLNWKEYKRVKLDRNTVIDIVKI